MGTDHSVKKLSINDVNLGGPDYQNQSNAPSSSDSYGLPNIVNSYQGISDSISLRGGPETGRTSTSDFLSNLQKDPAALRQFLVRLYNSGMYPSSVYKSGVMPNFNVVDENAQAAIGSALTQASNSNTGLYDILDSRSNAGLGITGGGNVYTIDLSDPASIRKAGNTVAQAALGRDLSKEEAQRYVGLIQGKQASSQGAANAAKEGASEANYAQATGPGLASYGNFQVSKSSLGGVQSIGKDFPGLHITSGYRDPARNKAAGGVSNSDHLSGNATDWVGSKAEMEAAKNWAMAHGARFAEVRDEGSGLHLHVSWGSSGAKDPKGNVDANDPNQYIDSTTVTTTAVDPQAELEEKVRQDHPEEAGAHDVANGFASFVNILRGGVQ